MFFELRLRKAVAYLLIGLQLLMPGLSLLPMTAHASEPADMRRRELQRSLPGGYARPTVQKGFLPTQKVFLILMILKLLMEQQRRRICTTLFEKHILNSIFPLPRPDLLSKKQ